MCTCQGVPLAPSAAPLRPAPPPRQGHATVALLALVPLRGTAVRELSLTPLLLTEGQYKKGGGDKACAPCRLLSFPPLPCPAPHPPQGSTKTDQILRLEGPRLAPSLPCALPLSAPSVCCSRADSAILNSSSCSYGPWGLQLGNTVAGLPPLPHSVENCLTVQLSSGALCLPPECCPSSGFLDAHRVTGRYCLIRVFFYTVGDSLV